MLIVTGRHVLRPWSIVLVGVLSILVGITIGQLVTTALEVSGIARILLSSAATFMVFWCWFGALMLYRYRRAMLSEREGPRQEPEERDQC